MGDSNDDNTALVLTVCFALVLPTSGPHYKCCPINHFFRQLFKKGISPKKTNYIFKSFGMPFMRYQQTGKIVIFLSLSFS